MLKVYNMTPVMYLDSLIAGIKMGSTIPVQLAELEFLRKLLIGEIKI